MVYLATGQGIGTCISFFLFKCKYMLNYNHCYMYIALNCLDQKILILFKLKVFADNKSIAETMGNDFVENAFPSECYVTRTYFV